MRKAGAQTLFTLHRVNPFCAASSRGRSVCECCDRDALQFLLIASEMPWLLILPAPVSVGDGDFWSWELELRHINSVWLLYSDNFGTLGWCPCQGLRASRTPHPGMEISHEQGNMCPVRAGLQLNFEKKHGFVQFPQQRNANRFKLSNSFPHPFHSYVWIICFLGGRTQVPQACSH